jgi:uncharacterized membrane protein
MVTERRTPSSRAHCRHPAANEFVQRLATPLQRSRPALHRGHRAFFFALGYLGWFLSPWLLMASTVAVVIVMWRRQFGATPLTALDTAEISSHAKGRRSRKTR